MRRTKSSGGFFLCLLLNMLLNAEWCIPAIVLLVLHFWLGWPLWPVFAALGAWILVIIFWMKVIGSAAECSVDKPFRQNKNPYSKTNDDIPHN